MTSRNSDDSSYRLLTCYNYAQVSKVVISYAQFSEGVINGTSDEPSTSHVPFLFQIMPASLEDQKNISYCR